MPTPPNFAFCDPLYGNTLTRHDAAMAHVFLPRGSLPVDYYTNDQSAEYHLPFSSAWGSVVISVEVAGAVQMARIASISLSPDEIRGMATYVTDQCVREGGNGGFVTKKLGGLVDYITRPSTDVESWPYPASTIFLTLSMTSRDIYYPSPGDFDPQMAAVLQKAEVDKLDQTPHLSHEMQRDYQRRVAFFALQSARMTRRGLVPWWLFRLGGGSERPGSTGGGGSSNLQNTTLAVPGKSLSTS